MSKHVLLTREARKNESWLDFLENAGFQVSAVPMIETRPHPCDMVLDEYDWIVFTSANTVRYFFEQQETILETIKIAVIGEKTATVLASYGYSPNFQPTLFTTEIFIKEWLALGLTAQHIFVPKSSIARDEIAKRFAQFEHIVTECAIYETVFPEEATNQLQSVMNSQSIDIAVFASPSAWCHFIKSYTGDIEALKIASIGPVTTSAIVKSGFSVAYEPDNYTMQQICELLIEGEL
ncbi:uroporphyrinogen-III synthase [Listeria sp. FSL L7-1582]|uniref:uroporphyrinogen-III synthase n=1 Tax=Listeria portnoyi TaxID=2713504 RepID=UPI00164D33F8|nr:uroporphyrinogen-III synthase [Listeria portnoyi]MBC6309458.1 uroporphyrinogen-III synthase [Listeria portnoyi]